MFLDTENTCSFNRDKEFGPERLVPTIVPEA